MIILCVWHPYLVCSSHPLSQLITILNIVLCYLCDFPLWTSQIPSCIISDVTEKVWKSYLFWLFDPSCVFFIISSLKVKLQIFDRLCIFTVWGARQTLCYCTSVEFQVSVLYLSVYFSTVEHKYQNFLLFTFAKEAL